MVLMADTTDTATLERTAAVVKRIVVVVVVLGGFVSDYSNECI